MQFFSKFSLKTVEGNSKCSPLQLVSKIDSILESCSDRNMRCDKKFDESCNSQMKAFTSCGYVPESGSSTLNDGQCVCPNIKSVMDW